MAYTITTDISRMLLAGQKEIFMRNFDAYPREYPEFTTEKTATKQTETYDSMGNLKAAGLKVEGDAITYGKVGQAYQTSVTNQTWANGYEVSIEATKYDLYGAINSVRAKELARTMAELEDTNAIVNLDNAFTTNLADGVPLCTNARPCINATAVNDTLATASSIQDPNNHKTMINMFNDFKNHAGGKMKSKATDALTHRNNQFTVEEIYQSVNKASEISNTKNVLPGLNWHYSTYISSQTAWFMWDNSFEHILFQWFMKTVFDQDEDRIGTKNLYFNAIAMYGTGVLPNIGFVGNAGL